MGLFRWSLVMAVRDARAGWRRLAMFGLSIVLGVAGLVAILGFRDTLKAAVAGEAKAVLGSDLELASRSTFGAEQQAVFAELGGEQAGEVVLTTMAFFPGSGDSRLVQLRAFDGDWPYFGKLEVEPADAVQRWRDDARPQALVERSLLLQLGIKVGAEVNLGDGVFRVAGALVSGPGESAAFGNVAPRILVRLPAFDETDLLKPGSFAQHKRHFRLPADFDVERWVRDNRARLRELKLSTETVAERQREIGKALENVSSFLSLAGFVALLLGAVGVASALSLHLRPKLAVIATLRCLGAPSGAAARAFLWQGLALGLAGALAGAGLGLVVQLLLPLVLEGLLPVSLPREISWRAIGQGVLVGCLTAWVFALWPLLGLGRVSPLRAIRAGFEEGGAARSPGWQRVLLGVATVGLLIGLAIFTTGSTRNGLLFAGGIALTGSVLTGAAWLATRLARSAAPRIKSYLWRQGVANLHRPNNRTLLLVTGLGLGLFLVQTLFLVRGALLAEFARATADDRPNLVIWDVQSDQKDAVLAAMKGTGVPATAVAPVVTMRIAAIDGKTAEELGRGGGRGPGWRLRREYRTTFRAETTPTETVTSGTWVGRFEDASKPAPISIEEDMARDLGLKVGSAVRWDVQGVPVETVIGSIRKVEWRGFSPNFFVVFPEGVLEAAPSFWMLAGRAPSAEVSAVLQRLIGSTIPGVSVLDLEAVLRTFDSITEQIGKVVHFMAAFTVATAFIVLIGALLAGKQQRVREAVLLRTLGASRRQVASIEAVEFLALGTLAALVGGALAWGAATGLCRLIFKLQVFPPVSPLAWGWLALVAATIALGWWTGRAVRSAPPLEVLRSE